MQLDEGRHWIPQLQDIARLSKTTMKMTSDCKKLAVDAGDRVKKATGMLSAADIGAGETELGEAASRTAQRALTARHIQGFLFRNAFKIHDDSQTLINSIRASLRVAASTNDGKPEESGDLGESAEVAPSAGETWNSEPAK